MMSNCVNGICGSLVHCHEIGRCFADVRQSKAASDLKGLATPTSLVLPFPLRPDFAAQIILPRDMTKAEADRLCAFIQALALPVTPG